MIDPRDKKLLLISAGVSQAMKQIEAVMELTHTYNSNDLDLDRSFDIRLLSAQQSLQAAIDVYIPEAYQVQ